MRMEEITDLIDFCRYVGIIAFLFSSVFIWVSNDPSAPPGERLKKDNVLITVPLALALACMAIGSGACFWGGALAGQGICLVQHAGRRTFDPVTDFLKIQVILAFGFIVFAVLFLLFLGASLKGPLERWFRRGADSS